VALLAWWRRQQPWRELRAWGWASVVWLQAMVLLRHVVVIGHATVAVVIAGRMLRRPAPVVVVVLAWPTSMGGHSGVMGLRRARVGHTAVCCTTARGAIRELQVAYGPVPVPVSLPLPYRWLTRRKAACRRAANRIWSLLYCVGRRVRWFIMRE